MRVNTKYKTLFALTLVSHNAKLKLIKQAASSH